MKVSTGGLRDQGNMAINYWEQENKRKIKPETVNKCCVSDILGNREHQNQKMYIFREQGSTRVAYHLVGKTGWSKVAGNGTIKTPNGNFHEMCMFHSTGIYTSQKAWN